MCNISGLWQRNKFEGSYGTVVGCKVMPSMALGAKLVLKIIPPEINTP